MDPVSLKANLHVLLNEKKFSEASDLLRSEEFFNEVNENGMDLISEVCDNGLNETEQHKDILACSEMLIHIAKHFSPKLAIIAFLEQAEAFNLSFKFSVIVQPLQIVLSRSPSKKPSVIAWILKVFNLHLKTYYSYPETVKEKYKDGENDAIDNNDQESRQILEYYNDLCNLYESLLCDILNVPNISSAGDGADINLDNIGAIKIILRDNLVDLLGPPLVYMDVNWTGDVSSIQPPTPTSTKNNDADKSRVKSKARIVVERIMKMISMIGIETSHFLNWVEEKELSKDSEKVEFTLSSENSDEDSTYDQETSGKNEDLVEPKLYSVSNFMYLLYFEKLEPSLMPASIYSTQCIFSTNLFLVNQLITNPEDNPSLYLKGLRLAGGMVDQISTCLPLTRDLLDQHQPGVFLERLTYLIIFCHSKPVRLVAINLFKKYLLAFDANGKYALMNQLLNTVNHSGLLGYCIGILKDFISTALTEIEQDIPGQQLQKYFLGSSMLKVLQPLCELENGVRTDLVRSSDQIIATLNMLRFLFIRDGATNKSGIKDILTHVETNFLKPLRLSVDLSKSHYKSRLIRVQESPNGLASEADFGTMEFELTVGEEGMGSAEYSKDDQLVMLNSALSTLDLIESLLVRTNEIVMVVSLTTNKIN